MKRLVLAMALLVLSVAPVGAQSRSGRVSPTLALARICVSEANWGCFNTGDGLAIHEVLLRGAERHGMSYVAFAAAYARRVVGDRVPTTERGRWIRELNEAGTAPFAWPRVTTRRIRGTDTVRVTEVPPWSHYREGWLSVVERARQVVREYTLENVADWRVCSGDIHDWGGAMDRARAGRLGLIPVECTNTSNDFYARPSLVDDAVEE